MKESNTANRLKKIMNDRDLKQIDILKMTLPYCNKYGVKMNKSDISQYCSGKVEPNQNKLFVLGAALNVNEAWLMGYDVPMERNDYEDQTLITFEAKLESAIKILETGGYTVSFSDNAKDDVITIISAKHEPLSCMHDYELVNKYDSLQQRNMLTAEALAEIDLVALDKYKAARKEYARLWNIQFFEKKLLESFSKLTDENKKRSINYTENLLVLQNMDTEQATLLNAAHDNGATKEQKINADNIMMDDSEWE